MKTLFMRAIMVPVAPLGGTSSIPCGIDTAVSSFPAKPVKPLEHPQSLESSGPGPLPVLEPTNTATLAT